MNVCKIHGRLPDGEGCDRCPEEDNSCRRCREPMTKKDHNELEGICLSCNDVLSNMPWSELQDEIKKWRY